MRGFRYPIGPEAPGTYWGRRVMAGASLLIAIGLLILGVKAFSSMLFGKDEPNPEVTRTSAAATVPTSSTKSPNPSQTVATSAGVSATVPTSTEIPVCDPANIKVSLRGNSKVAIRSEEVFDVGLTNATPQVCTLDLSGDPFQLVVTSGSDRIWTSVHCPADIPTGVITMEPAEAHTFQVKWPTKRSYANCKLDEDDLKSGTYVATASLTGGTSATQRMVLYWE